MEESLLKRAVRLNLVVGHHEGESRRDTKIRQKADEDRGHDADGDGAVRIWGFFPCRVGEHLGLGKHRWLSTKSTLLLNFKALKNLLSTPMSKGSPIP